MSGKRRFAQMRRSAPQWMYYPLLWAFVAAQHMPMSAWAQPRTVIPSVKPSPATTTPSAVVPPKLSQTATQPEPQIEPTPDTGLLSGVKNVLQKSLQALTSPIQNVVAPTLKSVKEFKEDPLQSMPEELNNQAQAEALFRVSHCQDSYTVPQKLDLLEAIDIALCNNPKARQSWAAMKGRAAEVGQRRGAYLPTINATATIERTTTFTNENAAPTSNNISVNRTLTAALNWRVFDFGTRKANLTGTRYLLQSAFFEHDTNIQNALNAVIQAYFQAQTTRARWQTYLKSEGFYQQILESAMRKQTAGLVPAAESLKAEVNLARTQVEKEQAWAEYQNNLVSLLYAMGVQSPMREDMDLVESLDVDSQDGNIGELSKWVDLVRSEHPTVKSFQAAIASYDEQIKAQIASKHPYLDLSLNASRSLPMQASLFGGGTSTTSAAKATLTVPIFEGFIPHYQLKALEIQKEGIIARRDEILDTLFRDLTSAYVGAKSAHKRLLATSKLVDVNKRALASIQRRFDAGLAPISDILTIQNDLVLAELTRIQNIHEWKQTRLSLLSAAAVLDKSDYTPGSALVDNLKPKWSLNNPFSSTKIQTTLYPQKTLQPIWKNAEDFLPAPPRRQSSLPAPLGTLNEPSGSSAPAASPAGLPIGVIRTIPK